jgi:hypothetical protein
MSKREQKKVIKDFVEQKIKQVKELNRKIIKDKNFYYNDLLSYERLDETPSLAWSPSCGLICDEWMNILFKYAHERRRKLFFGCNEWGMPTCWFDVDNKNDLKRLWQKKILEIQDELKDDDYHNFMSPNQTLTKKPILKNKKEKI